jgi:hypothetical protein
MPASGGRPDTRLRCKSVDQQRGYPGDDGDQRWYDGEEWERGRHGAQAPPAGPGAAYSDNTSYGGTESAPFGDARRGDAYERGYAGPRFGDTDAPGAGSEPAEAARRPVEAIDVAALRRGPAGAAPGPADYPPAYPPPPGAVSQPGPPYEAPAGAPYGPGAGPLGAPTAAVNMIQPGNPSVYQSRRPAVLIVLAVLTVVLEIPALRLLLSAAIEDVVSVPGVVAGTFLVAGLPAFAYGLYGLLGGGVVTTALAPWLRAPLIYLPVGALLFLFAALAAA